MRNSAQKENFTNEFRSFINEYLDRSNNLAMGLIAKLGISTMMSGEIIKITAICKSYFKMFKYLNKNEHCIKNIVANYIKMYIGRK